ncbi:hypothetical protein ABWL39_13760 [Chitinivorax sp. PXF-14]|uniref:hypothetical protein n=1 Tax=Chitinivorax sp. PXF-14 TaxID=3230488 RepID=UPI0034676D26
MRIPSAYTRVNLPDDSLTVRAKTAMRATPAVVPRSIPPLIYQPHHAPLAPVEPASARPERERRAGGERRTTCRRVLPLTFLLDLRQHLERRRHNRRRDDPPAHVDEEV